jgi:hypothetical protein
MEAIQHGLDVSLRGMRPDGKGHHEIRLFAKNREVEIRVVVEARLFGFCQPGFKDVPQTGVYLLLIGIDAEVAAAVKKVDEPVNTAQAAAADIQYFGLRDESLVDEVDEQIAPGDVKVLKPVPQGQSLSLDLLCPIDQ